MPNVSTYIRADDLAKYLEVSKKPGAWSEFIHNALNQDEGYSLQDFKDGIPQADIKAMSGTSERRSFEEVC